MLNLPSSTEFGRRVPKQKFYEHLDVSPEVKRLFIDQIKLITWANKLSPQTMNLGAGQTVTEIEVFHIRLTGRELDKRTLELMDRQIPYHILFVLERPDGQMQLRISYKEASQSGDNAFRVCYSDPDQGRASAQYIGEHKLATKIAIIYDSSSEYSDGIRESFVAEVPNQGLEVVASEAFTSDNNTDFSVQLDKAKESGADLVFLPIYYQEASVILKQANDKDFHPQFFGCDGMDGILSVDGFDKSLAEGLMLLTPFSVDEESSQDFVTAYRDAYGIDPLQFAADAYDGVYAIKAAAEKAEITPDMSTSDICDALKTAMTEIQIDGLTGTEMHWTAEGEPQKAPKAVEIKDGKYEMMQ